MDEEGWDLLFKCSVNDTQCEWRGGKGWWGERVRGRKTKTGGRGEEDVRTHSGTEMAIKRSV